MGLDMSLYACRSMVFENDSIFDEIKKKKIRVKFHLKIDTGMNRFGVKSSEVASYIYNVNFEYP